MDIKTFQKVLKEGESVSNVEFKRCGSKAESDTFETICSFANHSGGNIFLGVEDNGNVSGVNKTASLDIKRNIINVINNPNIFKPTVALDFDTFDYKGKQVIRIWVPEDAFVHSYKGNIYDRNADVDYKLKLDSQISDLYLRKQSSYTEQKIYPYVEKNDLELDLLEDVRSRASKKNSNHEWLSLTDTELLTSAGLLSKNYQTGEEGFNLAAVLLLGKEPVISAILPAYKTDAILRVDNQDRYDDRITVKCNLLRAYPLLENFCKRYLADRFYLEDNQAISPRDIIVRELISNILIHREYSSSYQASVIITAEEIYTENGSKPAFDGMLDMRAFNPMPKNPIIAGFFNNIGLADELGSGARNLLKYAKAYSTDEPTMIEGNVFRTSVSLKERAKNNRLNPEVSELVAKEINAKGFVTVVDVRDKLGIDHKAAQRELKKLEANGLLRAEGNTRGKKYFKQGQ
jgi:ATP-dependent DNA helicase RecG